MNDNREPLITKDDKKLTFSQRFADYTSQRVAGDAFAIFFYAVALGTLLASYFAALYPNGKGITGSGTNNTDTIQAETDKSVGGHEAWDWILFVSGLFLVIQTIQVIFLDLFWMRKKESTTYKSLQDGDKRKCKLNERNVYLWMYIFLGVHSLAGLWHIINVVHTLIRVADVSDGVAFTYYSLATTATVCSLAGTVIMVGLYAYGVRRFAKACKTGIKMGRPAVYKDATNAWNNAMKRG